jgi:hypothetical protein
VRTWAEFEYRRVTDGARIGHLYIGSMSFHAVFKLFPGFICNRFESTLITQIFYNSPVLTTPTVPVYACSIMPFTTSVKFFIKLSSWYHEFRLCHCKLIEFIVILLPWFYRPIRCFMYNKCVYNLCQVSRFQCKYR